MSQYKCISCGEIRDTEKEKDKLLNEAEDDNSQDYDKTEDIEISEKEIEESDNEKSSESAEQKEDPDYCSCPVCGYKMFKLPYDRKAVLTDEIRKFLTGLRLGKSYSIYYSVYRIEKKEKDGKVSEKTIDKSKDDNRFPGTEEICSYIRAANKSEKFIERLQIAAEQVSDYIHTPYENDYTVKINSIKNQIDEYDSVITEGCKLIGFDCSPDELVIPKITLHYSEIPNEELGNYADKLISQIDSLTFKIGKFIKLNNIYGTAFKKNYPAHYKAKKDEKWTDIFEKQIAKAQEVIDKKYIVDIFEDGSKELDEMLKTLWKSFAIVSDAPILVKSCEYTINDEIKADEKTYNKIVKELIDSRYSEFDEKINSDDFLSSETEESLFKLYNEIIKIDRFSILNVNQGALLQVGESENKLNTLIGLNSVKESIQKIKAYALANKGSEDLNLHMCFLGNPGTGKTEVARIIAGILYENKILPSKKVVEVDRSGLVSQYFGATAEKTKSVIQSAMGGVLFVDEAYALGNNSDSDLTDYGKEAIDTLVKAMEDSRGKFCVILAGYKNEMQKMMAVNPGFNSRIQFKIDFPNYNREELSRIIDLILEKRKYNLEEPALNKILDICEVKRKEPNFANAREVRNILDQVIMCQNLRVLGSEDKNLGIVDVNKYIKDSNINLPTYGDSSSSKIMTGDEELDSLIGLESVKKMIKKIKAYAKRNADDSSFNMHMCFYGNPGTGKTEVARILSRILYDAGVLSEAKLVETDAKGLIGKFVGETGPKTEAKVQDAMGGVLFIDEAYALTANSSGNTSYGDEAIAVLLKDMEDYRGKFCTILAGYRNEMEQMLSSNPGFESRMQFTLDFPDYTREELGEIAVKFVEKKKYKLADDALMLLLDVTEYFRNRPNFANARTIRNILDQVIMNQNLRTDEDDDADPTLIITDDIQEYIDEENIKLDGPASKPHSIGFI